VALNIPFGCVLIANRGEIALRIARTCRAMGIRTVAVYSDADAGAPHARACDLAIRIGPPPVRDSYLRIEAIVEAAQSVGAQAIHPGYGFLSENAAFAEACAAAGIAFVGPPPAAMRVMGDKIAAKKTVEAAGVPTVAGYLGGEQSIAALTEQAKRIGLPILVKAAAGGGGKGMRLVTEGGAFADSAAAAKREAQAAFGDDTVFLERFLSKPRHIEIQILADAHGRCISLGERECSIQRRHQKVLEETPSTAVSPALREQLGHAAVRAASAVGYRNAGTVEFMLDASGAFYFLEMNTRLQVEHPITELVTGVDLVRAQLLIAAGHDLPLRGEDASPRGHAIEVRIYAEDAENDFLPSTGRITHFELPEGPGIRNDAGVETGSIVTADYDPMLAKLIVYDRTRDAAIERLKAALDEYLVGGVTTNIPFLRWIAGHPAFAAGATTTAFIADHFRPEQLRDQADGERALLAAAAAWAALDDEESVDPWRRLGAWRHSSSSRQVTFGSHPDKSIAVWRARDSGAWHASFGRQEAIVEERGNGIFELRSDRMRERFAAWRRAASVVVSLAGRPREFAIARPPSLADAARGGAHDGRSAAGVVQAPMSGTIVKVDVRRGDAVRARQVLVVMEAMKMEHAIVAPYDGVVKTVRAKAGGTANSGDALIEIEPA